LSCGPGAQKRAQDKAHFFDWDELGSVIHKRDASMKSILSKTARWIVGTCLAFGLGVALGQTEVHTRKESPELPVNIVVRQPDREPNVLYLGRASPPGRWYNLPPGYAIIPTNTGFADAGKNFGWNSGVEGPTTDAKCLGLRLTRGSWKSHVPLRSGASLMRPRKLLRR
jgi:hypothetical protein